MPIDVIFEKFYLTHSKEHKKPISAATEEHLFRNWILPILAGRPLKNVSAFDCDKIQKRMRTAGKSERTIEYTLAVLRQIFTFCRRNKLFSGESPLGEVTRRKFDNRKQRFLSHDEASLLLNHLKTKNRQLYLMAMVSLHAGLRAGEIFSLTWGDLDIENGLLLLRDTKNKETRYGFMTQTLKGELSELVPGKPSELIFKDRFGKKIKSISATWDRVVDKLGLNEGIADRRLKFTFHGLRHTFASNLVASGIDLFRVQQLLGHKTPKMTLRYAHMSPEGLRDAVNQMEASIFNEPKAAKVIPLTRKVA